LSYNTGKFDAIIVGSGAGGGPVAWTLTNAGKKVVIIEAGGFYTTNDFTRFELLALRNLWWKPRWTSNYELGLKDEIALGMGRCVGGSTTIFTAVAHRMPDWNYKEWYEATGVVNENGESFSEKDLEPYFQQAEKDTSVRDYTEWDEGLKRIDQGFRKLGHPFHPVKAYVNLQCDQSGCLFGCPTEAKRGTLVSYIIPSVLLGAEVFYNSTATKILFATKDETNGTALDRPKVIGVEFVNEKGEVARLESKTVVVAAGAMNTPLLLLDSGIESVSNYSKSSEQIGQNFGVNTAAMVFGKFEDTLNDWVLHPLSGHMEEFAQKEKGGFLLEASEVMEGPLGFAEFLVDDERVPLWGRRHKQILRDYKHFAGVFINIHDSNDGRVFRDKETGQEKFHKPLTSSDKQKMEKARSLCREAFHAAGANEIFDSIYASHHVQGTCRMGKDQTKSVVDSNCKSHDIDGLYIVDGSILPSVIDANPSLTIMALSLRLGQHLLATGAVSSD
jgi:choline dehydrogenase-like flavoprotein